MSHIVFATVSLPPCPKAMTTEEPDRKRKERKQKKIASFPLVVSGWFQHLHCPQIPILPEPYQLVFGLLLLLMHPQRRALAPPNKWGPKFGVVADDTKVGWIPRIGYRSRSCGEGVELGVTVDSCAPIAGWMGRSPCPWEKAVWESEATLTRLPVPARFSAQWSFPRKPPIVEFFTATSPHDTVTHHCT